MENLDKIKNIGLIVGTHSEKVFDLTGTSILKGYVIKKILLAGDFSEMTVRRNYPDAEIVKDKYNLMHDASLDLIVFNKPINKYPDLIRELLQAGIPLWINSDV